MLNYLSILFNISAIVSSLLSAILHLVYIENLIVSIENCLINLGNVCFLAKILKKGNIEMYKCQNITRIQYFSAAHTLAKFFFITKCNTNIEK